VLDWIVGGTEDAPPTTGDVITGSLARQPEIIGFLSDIFGRYPWRSAGAIIDDEPIGFALETQTRPVYDFGFFSDSVNGDSVVVHELAHQWVGDSLRVKRWQHIWLNEGFATYAEWLWAEHEGLDTPQAIADFFYNVIPEDDPFWQLTIGDPGPEGLFDFAVYARGAMTLQALRVAVGDADFFRILKVWTAWRAGRTTTTEKFIALAERISGEQLDELFETWLFTPGRPAEPPSPGPAARGIRPAPESAPDLLAQLRKESLRR
jgi:hypothetical protein